jgi:hypothetical protein
MITIGFSRASDEARYQLYVNWLTSVNPLFEYINFYGMDIPAALEALERCSGIVLTGGADVHPSHYGKGEDDKRCECDLKRDILEFALIEKVLMAPAGFESIETAKQNGKWSALDNVEELIIPPDLQLLFDKSKKAFENWEKFSRSVKRGILERILNAKRPETRQKRTTYEE